MPKPEPEITIMTRIEMLPISDRLKGLLKTRNNRIVEDVLAASPEYLIYRGIKFDELTELYALLARYRLTREQGRRNRDFFRAVKASRMQTKVHCS